MQRSCESLTPTAKQSETSAGAFDDAHNDTDATNTNQENTAEAMLVRTAANIAPDATWTQLLTLWPWPSFKDASLEAAGHIRRCTYNAGPLEAGLGRSFKKCDYSNEKLVLTKLKTRIIDVNLTVSNPKHVF